MAARYATNGQGIHLSEAKRCSDQADHLNFRDFASGVSISTPGGFVLGRCSLQRRFCFGTVGVGPFQNVTGRICLFCHAAVRL
jgi:hypothetical protein